MSQIEVSLRAIRETQLTCLSYKTLSKYTHWKNKNILGYPLILAGSDQFPLPPDYLYTKAKSQNYPISGFRGVAYTDTGQTDGRIHTRLNGFRHNPVHPVIRCCLEPLIKFVHTFRLNQYILKTVREVYNESRNCDFIFGHFLW